MISDEELNKHLAELSADQFIRGCEEQMLAVMKARNERYASEQNDREWLELSDYVLSRRDRHRYV